MTEKILLGHPQALSRLLYLQILFQNSNSFFHIPSEDFLHFFELVFFVQVVQNFAVGLFSVPADEDCLCLACGGSVVACRVESFFALFEFRAVKAAVKIFFPAAFYVRAFSAGKHRAERAAVEYRAAASAPFAQKAVAARKSADCRHVNALFCGLHDFAFSPSAVFQSFLFFLAVSGKFLAVDSCFFATNRFCSLEKFVAVFFIKSRVVC